MSLFVGKKYQQRQNYSKKLLEELLEKYCLLKNKFYPFVLNNEV